MNRKKEDLKKLAKRETYFSTLAKKEGKGASERAKEESRKGLKQSAKDSRWEAKQDKKFASIRKKIAVRAGKKLNRM